MKALIVKNKNIHTIDQLEFTDVNKPTPNADQVLIKVHAAGLNPVDYKVVESGVEAWKYPHTLGIDVAGEIVEVGENVTDFKVGDRVAGHGDLTQNGCFAEYVTAPAYELAKIPDNVTYEDASALLCGALTAYLAIEIKPNLTNVRTVLIHAGAGGVGSIAIQLAKLHNLKVITTVSTSKIDFVKQLHPDEIIDYRTEDVSKRINELTNGLGVDLIIDTVGKAEAQEDLNRLAYNGQLVTIVDVPDFSQSNPFARALSMGVVNLGGAHLSGNPYQQTALGTMAKDMFKLASEHKVDPLIEKVLTFDQIPAGLQMLKEHKTIGKIIAKID